MSSPTSRALRSACEASRVANATLTQSTWPPTHFCEVRLIPVATTTAHITGLLGNAAHESHQHDRVEGFAGATTRPMPLAHPTSATRETVEDFQKRINGRGEWGRTRYGWEKVELVMTRESAERLMELLAGWVAQRGGRSSN